jgi:hypothetical protein
MPRIDLQAAGRRFEPGWLHYDILTELRLK